MKIPALKGKIGTWNYYSTILTFQQVNDYVSKIDDELHRSKGLKDLIQRSITDNFKSIKEYVLKQPEVFFNSLVLAVYDDYPNWVEVEITYENFETYQLGLLDFPSKHKIFPVDGQHRVEGIKAALKENSELANMKISAIFIGHKNDENGMEKTRRLFSTLNRYAKPVTMNDIIALDEDDIVAIITRNLLEDFDLFENERVIYSKQKGIPRTNTKAFTSIITLYQCNLELLKNFYEDKKGLRPTSKRLEEYRKFRKSEKEINDFYKYCSNFWSEIKNNIDPVKNFVSKKENLATNFRHKNGGNILFRPIGLLPFVKAVTKINISKKKSYKSIIKKFNSKNLDITKKPWEYVVWNPISKSMIMNNSSLIELIFRYKYDNSTLTLKELDRLKKQYAAKINFENKNLDKVLKKL